jgi:hypothetical protein
MSKHYLRASADVLKIVTSIIDEHYKELRSARVTIEALTVHSDKEGEPALTLRGRECGAIIRKTNTKERVAGRADAEIILDREYFKDLTARQRRALLHHELHHLLVRLDKDDEIKRDTAGRPMLAMREHDYEVGWFHEIAGIYGADSGEVMQARTLLKGKLGQIYFDFPEAPGVAAADGGGDDGKVVNLHHTITRGGKKIFDSRPQGAAAK